MNTYIYRLRVSYPPNALEPGWEPPGWTITGPNGYEDYREFNWPQRRNDLTRNGAVVAKRVLEGYGATVTIERSEPVTWPSTQAALDSLRAKLAGSR